jgi:D-alanyl-lipoteichoic acid acyltransferase DltB (MBOAT superfamily)
VTGGALFLLGASLLAVALAWWLPRERGLDAVAAVALSALALLSPWSAAWLLGSSLGTVGLMRHWRGRRRGLVVALASGLLVALLFVSRELPGIYWIGGAYFTLRHLHVLVDWWMERLQPPTIADYLRYSLFLPVLMAGPIHRLDHFQRQQRRRRLSGEQLAEGAERALFGLAQLVLVSGWGLRRLQALAAAGAGELPLFCQRWITGAFDWLHLYFSFAGLTSLALGLALMMGLRLEENFNRPWQAQHLIDFWSRWHMTLSRWCRDYVFAPVTAVTRLPLLGLVLAMLAMGLWHDSSPYYVLWAMWQSLGIALTHIALRLVGDGGGGAAARALGTLSVMLWLSLTRPVVQQVIDGWPW